MQMDRKKADARQAFTLIELLVVIVIIGVLAADDALTEFWQIHSKGQNLMFADGHTKWYKSFHPDEMTFSYKSMTNWINPNL
jgi:prepilin-type N-terminal cleavage/methylation domain-containing protein/prepilin-type processing-associated H-X9-DG protein